MPASDTILDQLTVTANQWRWLAAGWHVVILVVMIDALLRRPSQRRIATLLAVPMVSVGILAAWAGNPFNAITFMSLALLLAVAAKRMDNRRCALGSRFQTGAGVLLFAFGLIYPHFVAAPSWTAYFYMSPFGLLPCPTLAGVAGISLILGAFGSRRWAGTLVVALLAYGGIGVMALGVWMDTMLIVGAVALLRPDSESISMTSLRRRWRGASLKHLAD